MKRSFKHSSTRHAKVPWFLWPFWAIFRLVAFIIGMVGRLVALILGVVFMFVGGLLSLTIVGAIVGIPMFLFGAILAFKAIF